ncbi:MAG: hypothetical protein Tsb0014_38690 [Pleurocapsa sp.]
MVRFINKFIYAAIAFLLTSGIVFKIPALSATKELALIYPPASFPGELKSWILLIFRVGIGIIFILHAYPKLTHLKQWSKSIKMPVFLCFIGAATMFLGGFCLIAGFLTGLASIGILGCMALALFLHIKGGKPFVAQDPYLTPPDDYQGPKGKGEAPSMEKAFVYILIMLVLTVFGPGMYSLDAILFPNLAL